MSIRRPLTGIEREAWQAIEADYRQLATAEDELAAYRAEMAEWISAELGGLAASASKEYPEYN
jgi:hypothetical protein